MQQSSEPEPEEVEISAIIVEDDEDLSPVVPVALKPLDAPIEDSEALAVQATDVDGETEEDEEALAVAVLPEGPTPILSDAPLDLRPPEASSMRKEKLAAVLAAVLVHLLLAVVLGVLIVAVPSPPSSEITAMTAPVVQEVLPTVDKIVEPPPQAAPQVPSSVKFMTANNASAVPMPAVEFDPVAADLDIGSTMGSFNANFASTGAGSMVMFGKELKTRSIAVVMDVSGSMTPYLPIVAKELDKVAPGSNLVLFSGCGLLEEPSNVDRELYRFSTDGQSFKSRLPPEVYDQISKRSKTYFIKARNINHAQTAILSRRTMMADAIYWFADFQDAVDVGVMRKIVETFKAKNKVIHIHAVRRGKSFDPVVEHLVKPLKGEVIETKVDK
jgi:hypothetical protein